MVGGGNIVFVGVRDVFARGVLSSQQSFHRADSLSKSILLVLE